MDGWDIALLALAAYVAVAALVRMMVAHRDNLADEFRRELKRARRSQPPAASAAASPAVPPAEPPSEAA